MNGSKTRVTLGRVLGSQTNVGILPTIHAGAIWGKAAASRRDGALQPEI